MATVGFKGLTNTGFV